MSWKDMWCWVGEDEMQFEDLEIWWFENFFIRLFLLFQTERNLERHLDEGEVSWYLNCVTIGRNTVTFMMGWFILHNNYFYLNIRYKKTELPFRYPFTISKGTKTHQPAFVVELENRGAKGYGEAPAIAYYNIPVEKMMEDLERKKMFVEKFAFMEPERYWHYLHHLFPQNHFLVCALDIAAWDMYGKLRNKPLYQLWNLDFSKAPICDYTIGIDTVEKMVEKMKENSFTKRAGSRICRTTSCKR